MRIVKLNLTDEQIKDLNVQLNESPRLSLEEVAKLSKKSLRTIQRHIKDNVLEFEYLNGKKVVSQENFNNYLKRK